MRTKLKRHGLFFLLLFFSACASPPAPSNDVLTGTWSGDYEVAPGRRESISVDLRWEATTLSGVIQSGFRSLPLTRASFKPDTGAITMEFNAEGNGGRTVHYVVEGIVNGKKMSGSWIHDNQRGDFQVTKK